MQEKPDVVVVEIAEQHIRNLASLNIRVFENFESHVVP
jgi:hypothetical protein